MTDIKATVTELVSDKNTAMTVGSGSLPVYATPAMLALMEKAACEALKNVLDDGVTTVGTSLDVKHLAATPVGMQVSATAELVEQEGRRFLFKVTAFDEKEMIGQGMHERFSVFSDRFVENTNAKISK
jgi:predicted thioesterase